MGCENIAIAPLWWDGLAEDIQETITDRVELMVDCFTATDKDYLKNGLEGVCKWKFKGVISEMGED